MVSDFLTATDGRLEIHDDVWQSLPGNGKFEDAENAAEVPDGKICRRACQYVEYGKQQGYWGGKDVVNQVFGTCRMLFVARSSRKYTKLTL